MSRGSLYVLLSRSSTSACPCGQTCNDDENADRRHHLYTGTTSVFCSELCSERAQEVCEVLERALSLLSPAETAASKLKNVPEFSLNILQSLLDSRPDKNLRRTLLELAKRSNKLPKSLFLENAASASVSKYVCSGDFADVFTGKYEGRPVALKHLRVLRAAGDRVKMDFYREALKWRNLSHRHVFPFHGIDSNLFYPSPCMVSPWMPAGNVRDAIGRMMIKGLPGRTQLEQTLKWFTEISIGLEYLHNEGIVHGGLRGSNILIDSDNHIRIADFGLATLADAARNALSPARGGHEQWLAPEVMCPEAFGLSSTRPTFASDIYSLACLGIELFTGNNPFQGISTAELLVEVPKGLRPSQPETTIAGMEMPNRVWEVLCMCWEKQPSDRPDIQDVVKYANARFLLRRIERWETTETSRFLDKVFDRSINLPRVYEATSWLLDDYLNHGKFRTTPEVAIQHAADCLSEFPELIEGFNAFLPTGLTFRLSDDFDRIRTIVIERGGVSRVFRASFGLIDVRPNDPEYSRMDEQILNFLHSALTNKDHCRDAIATLREGDAKRVMSLMLWLVNEDDNWKGFLARYPHCFEEQQQMRGRLLQLLGGDSSSDLVPNDECVRPDVPLDQPELSEATQGRPQDTLIPSHPAKGPMTSGPQGLRSPLNHSFLGYRFVEYALPGKTDNLYDYSRHSKV